MSDSKNLESRTSANPELTPCHKCKRNLSVFNFFFFKSDFHIGGEDIYTYIKSKFKMLFSSLNHRKKKKRCYFPKCPKYPLENFECIIRECLTTSN